MSTHAQSHTLELLGGPHAPACENRSLRFSRYTDPALKEDARRAFLDVAIAQKLPENVRRDHLDDFDAFLDAVPGVIRIYAENKARLLLNMSGGVMVNAGCSLDRLTGLPIIPGSAIKGVARHAALDTLKSEIREDKPAYLAKIALVFGWTSADWMDQSDFAWAAADALTETISIIERQLGAFPKDFAGAIAFFSAMPRNPLNHDLELDIVTSHHRDYYSECIDVALDNEQPNPVVFPAVATGHVFGFALAPLCRTTQIGPMLPALLDCARQWLISGIETYGLGAKTAAGYGWFDAGKTETIQREKERQRRQAAFDAWRATFTLDGVPPEELAVAIREAEDKLGSFEPLRDQTITDMINRNKARLPQKNALDKLRDNWNAAPNLKGIVNGDIKPFERASDEKKAAVIALLREPSGRGAEVWNQVKTGQKGDIAKAVDAIRVYCKNTLNLGKMPS